MSIFWLNSNGSNTAPFDTKEKGATTMESLRTQDIATTDTIMVARGSVTNDPVFNGATFNKVCSIIAEDDGINSEDTRPVINYTVVGSGPFWGGSNVTNDISVTGIKFTSSNGAPDWYTSFAGDSKFVFTDCLLIKNDGSSLLISQGSPFLIDRCVLSSSQPVLTVTGLSGSSVVSSTIINRSIGSMSLGGIPSGTFSMTDTVLYASNPEYANPGIIDLSNSTITNCIYWGTGSFPTELGGNANIITNLQNINPLLNTTTFRYAPSSPAIGSGTLLSNIGWDQITKKIKLKSGHNKMTPLKRLRKRILY